MEKVLYPVPFHPQKWGLSKWRQLGFATQEDATYWQESCCGILCLQMALEYFTKKPYRTVDLISQGTALNAYTHEYGWSHKGLSELAMSLGLHSTNNKLTTKEVVELLKEEKLVTISIAWGFIPTRDIKKRLKFWKKFGGHLALVVGYTTKNGALDEFIVHHTSIRENYNWEAKRIPLKMFLKGYTGRGIVFGKR